MHDVIWAFIVIFVLIVAAGVFYTWFVRKH